MLALLHPHLIDWQEVKLSNENLIIFRMWSGAGGTTSGTIVSFTDVNPSGIVQLWIKGSIFDELRCMACFQIKTYKCALAIFFMKPSFMEADMLNGKLVTTDNDPVPVQINQGDVSRWDVMTITRWWGRYHCWWHRCISAVMPLCVL